MSINTGFDTRALESDRKDGDRVLRCTGYDDSIRWRRGQRLEHLFEQRCDQLLRGGQGEHLAVDGGHEKLTYAELDARANQLARYLIGQGLRPGDRVALLSGQAVDGYVAMLAVLKAHAAYVPLDIAFPADRLAYIMADSGVRMVLTRSHLVARHLPSDGTKTGATPVCLDLASQPIAAESRGRLTGVAEPPDDLCYVIYTSGSTGRPKGVAVSHPSICNFVQVAAEVYGITGEDRVYQGMTIAFDFSAEEIWVPWMAGATLVPKPAGGSLLGPDLGDFLSEQRVSALCCVPTVLATLERDLPGLRFLLVSGESCPRDLISRWHRTGRRFLNVYGPTEATVTATWAIADPDRPVTIGVPLPTYSVVILDPDKDEALPPGSMGEIGIAGIGLADGYLNRPDLTGRAFIADFVGIAGNPSGRIYRSGDLGRVNPDGDIEHHGRIDTQVKVRGYRIELAEIESVLLLVPGVAQAVVGTYRPGPDVVELVAYYSLRGDAAELDTASVYQTLRERLPAYMVPSYLERLPSIPLLPSGKADRNSLPPPSGPRGAKSGEYVPPADGTERTLATVLADVLCVSRVSADSDFFSGLGASSLLMARFTAALRARSVSVSMKDVYQHPTIRRLAAAIAAPGTREPRQAPFRKQRRATGIPRYVACGALQILAAVMYILIASLFLHSGFTWVLDGHGIVGIYLRMVVFGGSGFIAIGLIPVVAKWLLIGRWKPVRVKAWSMGYLRFWVVKTLLIANPLGRLCVGTPLYSWYLRMLGAQVGRGTVIFSQHLPVCTDLLSVGAGTVIRKDAYLSGYHAWDSAIETGSVTIGDCVFVGEHSVIGIDTQLGDGAQLGHASALYDGQSIPAGECWHGSPAREAPSDHVYRTVPEIRLSRTRLFSFSLSRLLLILFVAGPLDLALAGLLLAHPHQMHWMPPDTSWQFYRDGFAISTAVLVVGMVTGLALAGAAQVTLGSLLRPGRVYPLYGFRHLMQRGVSRLTNVKSFNALFGDSVAVTGYLSFLGYRLKPVEQTGTNFGMTVKHEAPGLSVVGTGTMVSDGLSFMNAEFSATSFRVVPVAIGQGSFIGNDIVYPSGGRTGDNCLLATKVLVPIAGPVREGVGLLGSPSFEIPRSVSRDNQFSALSSPRRRSRLLRAKTRHNVVTMGLYLLVRLLYATGLVLLAMLPLRGNVVWGTLGTALTTVLTLVFTVGYFTGVEWATTRFKRLTPRFCSIYQRSFWRHERFWKVPPTSYVQMFNGTPLKGLMWRLLGVRVGRRLFDDGCGMTERSLVTLGDECTLAAATELQGHSLEDGVFKSDRITIGNGCSIGAGAFVHYGTTMGDGATLAVDSFLMKGESVPPGAEWGGNPATQNRAGKAHNNGHLRGTRVRGTRLLPLLAGGLRPGRGKLAV